LAGIVSMPRRRPSGRGDKNMPTLAVHLVPRLVDPGELTDSTTIVIDLLRASTTICHALAAGADCVMPFVEIEETMAAAREFGRDNVLLGGERGGLLIDGFDLGNSPAEYSPEVVRGRRILFTTTNGARALHHARQARHIYVGAAVNCSAVAATARGTHAVHILCAGTADEITREDILAAGAIVEGILADNAPGALPYELDQQATDARQQWQAIVADARASRIALVDRFADELHDTIGGRNLIATNQAADIALCANLDARTIVPEFNPTTNEIRPA
jgi:2-phosphosulfolactate phosphatase